MVSTAPFEFRDSTRTFCPSYSRYSIMPQAFWDEVYTSKTAFVSDKVTGIGFTPVGVDFYFIGERGDQYGPFGARYPIQKYNQTGRGYFRCASKTPLLNSTNANNSASGGRMLGGQLRNFFESV